MLAVTLNGLSNKITIAGHGQCSLMHDLYNTAHALRKVMDTNKMHNQEFGLMYTPLLQCITAKYAISCAAGMGKATSPMEKHAAETQLTWWWQPTLQPHL